MLEISVTIVCGSGVALMLRNAFEQRSGGLAAISGWAVFARNLVDDIASLRSWWMRLGAGKEIAEVLVGREC